MISRRSRRAPKFSAGGFDAPWLPPTPDEPATARQILILGIGVALAISVIAIGRVVVSGTPAALEMSPAYRLPIGQSAQPESVFCSVNSGECVMGLHSMTGGGARVSRFVHPKEGDVVFGSQWHAPAVVPQATIPAFNLASLTQPEMIGLMASSSMVGHQAIFHALRRRADVIKPDMPTYIALRERGLIRKMQGCRYHTLTTEGAAIEGPVAARLVESLTVHASYMFGGFNGHKYVRCTCGWKSAVVAGPQTQTNALARHVRHLRDVGVIKVETV